MREQNRNSGFSVKVFISSVIAGFENYREAAAEAVQSIGHDVIRAEDFPAAPSSSRVACLSGVREADAVILLLGERYGQVQASGKSATHEEFEEARGTKPLFILLQTDVQREKLQEQFVDEVRDWERGYFSGSFDHAQKLQKVLIKALHRWELESSQSAVAPEEMLARAAEMLPEVERHHQNSNPWIFMSWVGSTRQAIIRPSILESEGFQRKLQQLAMFGDAPILDPSEATRVVLEGDRIALRQKDRVAAISAEGAQLVGLALPKSDGFFRPIIEEDVVAGLARSIAYMTQVLDLVDETERIGRLAIVCSLVGDAGEWRTRREQEQKSNTMKRVQRNSNQHSYVHLSPPDRSRTQLRLEWRHIATDLMVLLRRKCNSQEK